jgi:mannose-6-phosphate isomerase-like protein (cupin superfamily)
VNRQSCENRDTAPAYWLLDALWVILGGRGRFSIMEQWMRGPGPGPPLHVHGFSDECLYVLDGQMEIQVGQKQMTGGTGQFGFPAELCTDSM